MANNYDKILELANANNMGLSNTIKRDFGIPLDYTSVQASYEAALTYAATNTLAYVGQPISVGDKLYIVTAESQGKYPAEVEEGESQIDVFLAEVGSATEGDGSTIDLKDGVLSLHGIDGKTSGTYVPTLVDGVLTWNVPDNTTVDGLTASVEALNLKVFGKPEDEEAGTDKVTGLVDIVESQAEEIAAIGDSLDGLGSMAYESLSDYYTKDDLNGSVITEVRFATSTHFDENYNELTSVVMRNIALNHDDQDDSNIEYEIEGRDGVEVSVGDYGALIISGTELSSRVKAIEDKDFGKQISDIDSAKADKATTLAGYNIGDAYTKEEVNSLVSSMTHMSTEVVDAAPSPDVAQPGVIYLVADDANVGTYVEYILVEYQGNKYVERIGTTATDLSDYATIDYLDSITGVQGGLATYDRAEEIYDVASEAFTDVQLTTDSGNAEIYFIRAGEESSDHLIDIAGNAYINFENVGNQALNLVATEALETAVANANAAKGYTDGKFDAATEAINDLSDAVNGELAKKIETAQIRHTSEGVGEGVTKDGTALTITVDAYRKSEVYTKSETDNQIDAKIASVTGGESAADVKLALESYRDAVNTEIWGAKAAEWTKRETDEHGKVVVTYTPQYGETSRVDDLEVKVGKLAEGENPATGLFAKVATAQAKADEAAAAVVTLENGQVKTNKENIAAILTRVGNVETQAATNKTDIATLTGTVNGINTTVGGHTEKITGIEAQLVTLGNKDTELDTAVKANAAEIAKKANSADVYIKGEVDAKVITSGEVVRGTIDSVAIANNKITVTLNSYTKAEVDNAIAAAVENIDTTAIDNAAADIAVLVGTDKDENGRATKSVRAIAKEEVELIVGAAPEALDTLEEVAEWIANDETGAAAMAADINRHKTSLAGIGGEGDTHATVVAAITAAKNEAIQTATFTLGVATAEKLGGIKSAADIVTGEGDEAVTTVAENKVYVNAETAVAEVKAININTLVQTDGDVLILNGGRA